ncbi:MAG: hypothetical protein OQL16_08250 [Gammaproteobacteria bacterium]|nr:hypothetical protein [Gammaproteobacteria bacterium]
MLKRSELPDRCIYCNEATRLRKNRRIYYLNPWLQVALLLLFLVFNVLAVIPIIIVILIFRKSGKISIPVCRRHWRKRLILTIVTLGTLAISIALSFASIEFTAYQEQLLAVGVGMFVFSTILAIVLGQMLKAKKIDAEVLVLKGARPAFLDSLPEYVAEQDN